MSLISRLFRRRSGAAQPARPQPAEITPPSPVQTEAPVASEVVDAPPPPVPEAPVPQPAPALPEPPPSSAPDEEPAADEEDAEAEVGEDDGADPFIGSGEPLQISLPTAQGVMEARQQAEALALQGPQRVTLADPAGPGSLAETLARLEAEGRVTSEVIDDPDNGLVILYRPRTQT